MHRQLLDMLNRQGVEVFESVGEIFDPREHEAVDKMPTKDYDPDTVIAQQAPGYRLHGRLLRAARVVVSVPPHGSDKSSEKSKK
jgi:molecular chaperone GrpE